MVINQHLTWIEHINANYSYYRDAAIVITHMSHI